MVTQTSASRGHGHQIPDEQSGGQQDAGPNDEERDQPHVPMRLSLARSSSSVSFALGENRDHQTFSHYVAMNIPDYITKEEVRRVCSEIGIRDWTTLTEAKITTAEADLIRNLVGGETLAISTEVFRAGLEVELEHGLAFSDANVTNNHPILTGRIVLAHLKEMLDYYVRLQVAEIEGDMLKALVAKNPDKLMLKYRLWLAARADLAERERHTAG